MDQVLSVLQAKQPEKAAPVLFHQDSARAHWTFLTHKWCLILPTHLTVLPENFGLLQQSWMLSVAAHFPVGTTDP